MVARRFDSWLTELESSPFESALAVTHAGVIRVALTRIGLLDLTRWASAPIDFGAVYRIEIAAGRARGGARLAT